jgi:hypothetical protein
MGARAHETLKERRQVPLHAAILDAIRAHDAPKAVSAVRRHFRAVAPVVEFVVHEIPRVSVTNGDRQTARQATGNARAWTRDTGRQRR